MKSKIKQIDSFLDTRVDTQKKVETIGWIGAAILIVVFLFLCPIFTIGALNTVFSMGIPYTVWSYLSVVWFNLIISGWLYSIKK
jgi:hypothetical protein